MTKYIDYGLTDKYPNKYHLTPKNIKELRILDWDRFVQANAIKWLNMMIDEGILGLPQET